MTVPVALAGVSGILSVSGISRKRCKTSPSSSLTLKASFVQPLSLAFARQLPWQGSPWQRGSVFDETDWGLLENVTECQSLSLWERWHCEAMTERARMLTKSKKTQRYKPCLSETSYRNAAGVISPGLPSQVARKCQKGTRWHGEAVTERARMLTKSKKHSDTSPVCQRYRIAVLSCFILPGLPSQALTRQLSQRESPWQRGQALVYASMPWSAGG